jgi:hypothetical protein
MPSGDEALHETPYDGAVLGIPYGEMEQAGYGLNCGPVVRAGGKSLDSE